MRLCFIFCLSLPLLALDVWADDYWVAQMMANQQVDYQLLPIVVTATRTPHTLWETNANVTLVTSAEIEQSTAQHLGDILKLLPGVNIGALGGIGQSVSLGMRGSSAGQVLILVDGVPINDPQHGGVDLNLISLDNVDRIEVIRGAASSLYGADAMGGVINVITRSSAYDKPFSIVTYQQGDHGLEKIGGRFDRRIGQTLSLNMMVSSTKSNGFRDNSDYLGRHVAGRFNYTRGDRWRVSYSTQVYDGALGVPGMDVFPTPNARQEDQSWNQTLTLQISPAQGHDLDVLLYRNSNQQEYKDPDWLTEAQHRWWVYGTELQHSFSFHPAHRVIVGGELQNRRLSSTENGQHDLDRGALFAQDEMRLLENIWLRFAGRYDYHEQFEDQFCPDITLTCFFGQHALAFASLRRSYRAPTFNDLYWPQSEFDYDFDGHSDYGESGNEYVRPERAVAFQLGARAQGETFEDEICIFRRSVHDLIQWDNVDQTCLFGHWMPVNTSQATIIGLESKITARICSDLKASLAYMFLDAKDELVHKRLPYQPRYQFGGYLQHEVSVFAKHLELVTRLEIEHLSQRYADAMESEKIPYSTVINGKVTACALKHFQVHLVAKNLGNKKYFLRSGYPLPGRTFYGGLSWEFWD